MDAFYASVEQQDRPELRGKPVAVGGTGARGVVAASSYEAREFGVRSAMPTRRALDLCPSLLLVPPRFDRYKEISNQVRALFLKATPLVEPLSLDEAYLDISEQTSSWEEALSLAHQLKTQIRQLTNLTASAGVSMNKFLAKLASDEQKPDGLTFISPEEAIVFLENLAVEDFFGVGKATANKMRLQGINNGKDLKQFSEMELARRFGKNGRYYYKVVRGLDDRPVMPTRQRKSVSVERTYSRDLYTEEEISAALEKLSGLLMERIERSGETGRTINLKVRYDDFTTLTRQRSLEHLVTTEEEVFTICLELMKLLEQPLRPIRLLGMGVSGFLRDNAATQLELDLKL